LIKEETEAVFIQTNPDGFYDYLLLKESQRINKIHREMDGMLNEDWRSSLAKELPHLGLDILGVIEPYGIFADIANAAWYAKKEEYLMGALSLISSIPIVGDLVGKGGKIGVYLTKYGGKGAAKASVQVGEQLQKHLPEISKMFKGLKQNKMVGPYIDDMAKAVSKYIDDAAAGGVEAIEKVQQVVAVKSVKPVKDVTLKKVAKQAMTKRAIRKKKELISKGVTPEEEAA